MLVVPGEAPVTIPIPSIVATDEVPLVQVPPVAGSESVVVLDTQTLMIPAIAPGVPFTVTVVVAGVRQPLL